VIVEQANLVRKRRISFLLACQTVGQLNNIYGKDGAATLLAGMATQIIFGGADKETATYFSSLAGNQTKVLETDNPHQPKRSVERPLLTHDQIISPPHAPQGNVILFTRYVTETYAVNAVILARLTRLYERQDWKATIAQAKGKGREVRLFTRASVEKRKMLPTEEEPMSTPAKTPIAVPTTSTTPMPPTPPILGPSHQRVSRSAATTASPSEPTSQFLYLRVVDDSPPPDQQNIVIPYPVRKRS